MYTVAWFGNISFVYHVGWLYMVYRLAGEFGNITFAGKELQKFGIYIFTLYSWPF
jgi:hypothetical protein